MATYITDPSNLIEYEELLERSFTYPYWQTYVNGINISLASCDLSLNCSFKRNDNQLSTSVLYKDSVSFILLIAFV